MLLLLLLKLIMMFFAFDMFLFRCMLKCFLTTEDVTTELDICDFWKVVQIWYSHSYPRSAFVILITFHNFSTAPVLLHERVGLQTEDEALWDRTDRGNQPGQHQHYPWQIFQIWFSNLSYFVNSFLDLCLFKINVGRRFYNILFTPRMPIVLATLVLAYLKKALQTKTLLPNRINLKSLGPWGSWVYKLWVFRRKHCCQTE